MTIPSVVIKPGLNYWLITRSLYDGASSSQCVDEIPAFMLDALSTLKNSLDGSFYQGMVSTGKNEWRIGGARPVTALPGSTKVSGLTKLVTRETSEGDFLPTVKPGAIDQAVLEFWWRGPEVRIPWPMFTANAAPYWALAGAVASPAGAVALGAYKLWKLASEAGEPPAWMLSSAYWAPIPSKKDPGDKGWGEAQTAAGIDKAKTAGTALAGALVLRIGIGIVVGSLLVAYFIRKGQR